MARRRRHEDQKALGRAIQALRESHELTPQVVAERAEIHVGTLKKIEKGEGETSWNMVVWIADAIGVSTNDICELEEQFLREEKGDESG